MRLFLASLLMLHGFAHVVGFAGAFKLSQDIPYKTTVLSGRLDLGPAGIRVVGLIWLIVAVTFVLIGLAGLANQQWWLRAGVAASIISLMLCMVELPEARVGMAINTIIILATIGAHQTGWI